MTYELTVSGSMTAVNPGRLICSPVHLSVDQLAHDSLNIFSRDDIRSKRLPGSCDSCCRRFVSAVEDTSEAPSPGVLGAGSVTIEEVPTELVPVDSEEVDEDAVRKLSSGLRRPSEFAIRRNVVFSNTTASTAPHARVKVVNPRFKAVLFGTRVWTICDHAWRKFSA